jgi:Protein of unknown function (DUF1761)
MPEISLLAVLVAALAAFAAGGAYYAAVGDELAGVSEAAAAAEPAPPWTLAVELGRCLLTATVVVGLASQGDIDEWSGGLLLGVALWIGFPFVLWVGAVVHEKAPLRLAKIHAGDWLVKLPLVGVIAALLV